MCNVVDGSRYGLRLSVKISKALVADQQSYTAIQLYMHTIYS